MRYSEAFSKLGYKLDSPRIEWSATNEKGVCISLWRVEIKFSGGLPKLDTTTDAGPLELWQHKPGNAKRMQHLQIARDRYDGRVDVVIVEGMPGDGVTDAEPWFSDKRGAFWRLESLDLDTGHFSVVAVRASK